MKNNSERVVFADYIRVVACFLVMLVHACENFYAPDANLISCVLTESNRFWVAFYDGTLGRTCVPLFMIVSAFLLVPMNPSQTMFQFYRRRFMRILPPMAVFVIIYCMLPFLYGYSMETLNESLHQLWASLWNFPSTAGHLWFMYPLMGLYLIIPVISPWLEKASEKEERFFITLFFLSSFLPFLRMFLFPDVFGECFWNEFHTLWYFSGFIGYLVLAHYIRYHLKWNISTRVRVGSLSLLVGSVFTGWAFYSKAVPGILVPCPLLEWAWGFCTPNVILSTFGAFLLFTCIKIPKTPAFIAEISRLSFGMYLMHMIFLTPISKLFIQGDLAHPVMPVWLTIPVIAVLTYLCTILTSKLISYLPGSKYIIGA